MRNVKKCCFRNILVEKLQKSCFRLLFFFHEFTNQQSLHFFHEFSKVAFHFQYFFMKSQTIISPFFEMKIQIISYFIILGPASARSYKIGVLGNNWLVGNAVFSETALRIFPIFYIKLGDYKGRKVTEPGFIFFNYYYLFYFSPKLQL